MKRLKMMCGCVDAVTELSRSVRMYRLFFFLLLLFVLPAVAQQHAPPPRPIGPPARTDKLESMKIAFFTDKLNLTPEEAKRFWPIYNSFQDEIEALRKSHRQTLMDAKENLETLTDKDIEKLVDGEITFRQNELDVVKKYHVQFKQVLQPRKVAKLYRAEEEWKRKILDIWRERKDEKMKQKD